MPSNSSSETLHSALEARDHDRTAGVTTFIDLDPAIP